MKKREKKVPKKATIGIMGALICNDNMGCVALTYSLLNVLEKIRSNIKYDFNYIIFEEQYDETRYIEIAQFLNIDRDKIKYAPVGYLIFKNWKLRLKSLKKNYLMFESIQKCDFIVDLTRGDSFTDLYGSIRFKKLSVIKRIVEIMKIPLILGPQTYGPFQNERNKKYAKKIVENAYLVVSRDTVSAKYLSDFCQKDVYVTTDVAFGLPYTREKNSVNDRIKVGINPSGLLVSKKIEGTQLDTKLKADYDKYIREVIQALESAGKYELHLIPHVGEDAVKYFENVSNSVIRHSAFNSPISAKNCISQMDIFIGSRMHATIGAISSGVITIPVAYSRKFVGLFDGIGYGHIVDLCTLDTETAIQKTLSLVDKYTEFLPDVNKAMCEVDMKYQQLYNVFESAISKLLE